MPIGGPSSFISTVGNVSIGVNGTIGYAFSSSIIQSIYDNDTLYITPSATNGSVIIYHS